MHRQGHTHSLIPKDEDLIFLNEIIETGEVTPVDDRTYQHLTAIPVRFIAVNELDR